MGKDCMSWVCNDSWGSMGNCLSRVAKVDNISCIHLGLNFC